MYSTKLSFASKSSLFLISQCFLLILSIKNCTFYPSQTGLSVAIFVNIYISVLLYNLIQIMTEPTKFKDFPPLNDKAKKFFEDMQRSKDDDNFQDRTKMFVAYLVHFYNLEEAIFKLHKRKQGDKIYDIEMLSRIKRDNYQIYFSPKIGVMYQRYFVSQFLKLVRNQVNFKPTLKEIQWKLKVKNYRDIAAQFMIKNDKPLNANWKTNVRLFALSKNYSQFYMQNQQKIQKNSMFYLNAKQYENTPLNNDAGIFQNQNLLLKTDTYELGYKMIKKSDYRTWKIKVGLGSNFNGVNYLRMKGTTFNYIPINELLNVKLFSNFGVMRASRVFQNEMFSRNKGKWMKERSKQYINMKAQLQFTPTHNIMNFLSIYPYLNGIVSRNSHNYIKLQGQYGITFKFFNKIQYGINLLQLANQKRERWMGIKYQF